METWRFIFILATVFYCTSDQGKTLITKLVDGIIIKIGNKEVVTETKMKLKSYIQRYNVGRYLKTSLSRD